MTAQQSSPRATRVTHLGVDERRAVGRAARRQCPRSSHAQFEPSATRPDPVDLLESQSSARLQELVPVRYGRMLVSPFTFYRGAALIMADDLAGTPTSGLRVQACGDAHLSNFGVFASPERSLVFDINDFDETVPGPWEWDVKRLITSLEIAGRANGHADSARRRTLLECAAKYRTAMAEFAVMGNLQVWYARLDIEQLLRELRAVAPVRAVSKASKAIAKARTRDSMQALRKLTRESGGVRRIVSQPPLLIGMDDLAERHGLDPQAVRDELRQVLRSYRRTLQTDRRHLLSQFEFVDFGLKVVGVGSVGTRAWVILLAGRDSSDPLLLQAKEATASVLEAYAGRSAYDNSGHRVVAGQRLMQSASDIFLGWQRTTSPVDGLTRDFYFRQLRDWKGSADVDDIRPAGLSIYGQMCAWSLAKAHARSGDRIAISNYLGTSETFDRAVADFAVEYADQNERDYAALRRAADEGRVPVLSGL